METTLSDRGQTAVPARIRKKFGIKPGQKLEWADDGQVIFVIPASTDPITHFRGSSHKDELTKTLLKSRQEDAQQG